MDPHRILKLASRVIFIIVLVSVPALAGDVRADASHPDSPDLQRIFLPSISSQDSDQTLRANVPADPVILRRLASGAPVHGSNGIYFGPDGMLYVASFAGGDITVMDPNSGRIVRRILPEQGMDGPDDLTFGPDGSLYWTSLVTGKVGKMDMDGTQSLVAQLPPGVNPITFSADGRLFVALDFLGDALYEVYLDGTPPRLIRENLGFLNAFDFGPDGYLYGPIITQSKVVKIDVETGDMWDVAQGFAIPASVKFDAAGRLYVVDQGSGEVVRLDLASGERVVIARLTPGLDNLAFDDHGRLFVSSAEDGFIVEVLPNGAGRPVSPGGMIAPGGVAVLPGAAGQDDVFVADLWVLRQFNGQTGQELDVERESMGSIHTVATDGKNLLLTSWMDNMVHVYDPASGNVLETRSDFIAPMNAVRFQGDLVVSELGTGSVVRSSALGDRQVLATLELPIGLAATDDDLWVADWGIGAVFQLVRNGTPVTIPLAFGLDAPEGLAVMSDGSLLVVESGAGRISRIDTVTGEVSLFVDGLELGSLHLSGLPPFWIFNGIAVGPSRAIYVTGDQADVLYRIDLRP